MDLCALYRTLEKYNLPLVSNQYICTMELAKKIFRNDESVQTYRVDVLSKKYGNYGSKYEKACQLNEKGKSILIVKESEVIH